MSDPYVDLEKGIAGLEEEKGITTELKEEEKAVHHQSEHLKVMCVKRLLDVYPVLFFVVVMYGALICYSQTHIWWQIPVVSSGAIVNFWICRKLKRGYTQHNTLASADSDLSTTLLAPSKK